MGNASEVQLPVRSLEERARLKSKAALGGLDDYHFTVPNPLQTCDMVRRWLEDRGGVVLYTNVTLDSSSLGDRAIMPKRYIAEDNQIYDAPNRIGDVPSRFKEAVDLITKEQYGGDVEKALAVFTFVPPPAKL